MFSYGGVHNNVRQRVIDVLRADGYDVDVFFVVRYADNYVENYFVDINISAIRAAIFSFQPVRVAEYGVGVEPARELGFDRSRYIEVNHTSKKPTYASAPTQCTGEKGAQMGVLRDGLFQFPHSLYRAKQ